MPGGKKRERRYNETLNKILKQRDRQYAVLQAELQQRQLQDLRHLLLIDFIQCQEELERILQAQGQLLEQAEQEPMDPNSNVLAVASGNNWCNQMLASATLQQLRQVQHMTTQDWCALNRSAFDKLPLLLELATRELTADTSTTAATTTGIATATATAGLSLQTVTGAAGSASAAAAASAPAAFGSGAAGPSDAQQGCECGLSAVYQGAAAAIARLEQEVMPLSMAAMFHNPQPYYGALACNQATGQVQVPCANHIRAAAERLELSPRQQMTLRVLHTEFGRLSQAVAQRGETLAALAAKLSLTAVAQGLQLDGEPAAAAGAGMPATPAPTPATTAGSGSSSGSGSSTATAHAAAAAQAKAAAAAADPLGGGCPGQGLSSQLEAYLRQMNLHTCVTVWGIVNTLAPHQRATHTVAMYPYLAKYHAIAEYCASLDLTAGNNSNNTAAPAAGDDLVDAAAGAAGTAAAAAAPAGPSEGLGSGSSGSLTRQQQVRRQLVDEHMARREAQLQQQAQAWWAQHHASPLLADLNGLTTAALHAAPPAAAPGRTAQRRSAGPPTAVDNK